MYICAGWGGIRDDLAARGLPNLLIVEPFLFGFKSWGLHIIKTTSRKRDVVIYSGAPLVSKVRTPCLQNYAAVRNIYANQTYWRVFRQSLNQKNNMRFVAL